MYDEKIRLLFDESFDPDERLIASLREIASLPDVYRVVGMVDLHLKRNTENPSSVAIASLDGLVPKLSSVAQNCGMSLAVTDLESDEVDDQRLDGFFERMRTEDDGIMRRPAMSMEDMRRVVCLGAPAVIERSGLQPEYLEAVEYGGTIGEPRMLTGRELARLVPRYSLDRGRYGFGVIPAGNHFLEIQRVDEVIDPDECARHGIREGGITVMIHSDGGLISDDIGNLYGSRTTARGPVRLIYNLRKTALHLRDAAVAGGWRTKREYYFSNDKFVRIDTQTREGTRYLEAKRLSMNAGYACRATTMGRVRRLLGAAFPSRPPGLRLLCDFSHNSIVREAVDGRQMWVHRHNACRVVEGQVVFLPGYGNTSSYICLGGGGARDFLSTMDHGAGKTIDRLRAAGRVRELGNGRATRSYSNSSPVPRIVPHWSDEGVDAVIDVLRHRGIARPIARLRPLAGYRYVWKGRLARARERLTAGEGASGPRPARETAEGCCDR